MSREPQPGRPRNGFGVIWVVIIGACLWPLISYALSHL